MYSDHSTLPSPLTSYFSVISAKWASSEWHQNQLWFSTLNSCQTTTTRLRCLRRSKGNKFKILGPNALENWCNLMVPVGSLPVKRVFLYLGSSTAWTHELRSHSLWPGHKDYLAELQRISSYSLLIARLDITGSRTSLRSDFTFLPQSAVHTSSADWWGSYYPNCPQKMILNHCWI